MGEGAGVGVGVGVAVASLATTIGNQLSCRVLSPAVAVTLAWAYGVELAAMVPAGVMKVGEPKSAGTVKVPGCRVDVAVGVRPEGVVEPPQATAKKTKHNPKKRRGN